MRGDTVASRVDRQLLVDVDDDLDDGHAERSDERRSADAPSGSQRARLVRADDVDRAEGLDGAERLAEDVGLLHPVGDEGQAGRDADGQALGWSRSARTEEALDVRMNATKTETRLTSMAEVDR